MKIYMMVLNNRNYYVNLNIYYNVNTYILYPKIINRLISYSFKYVGDVDIIPFRWYLTSPIPTPPLGETLLNLSSNNFLILNGIYFIYLYSENTFINLYLKLIYIDNNTQSGNFKCLYFNTNMQVGFSQINSNSNNFLYVLFINNLIE